jgi:hypothetical protein
MDEVARRRELLKSGTDKNLDSIADPVERKLHLLPRENHVRFYKNGVDQVRGALPRGGCAE